MSELRKKMVEAMQLRGLAVRTQKSYVAAVRQLASYYGRSPDEISDEELRAYFLYLRSEKIVSDSTCNVAHSGIKFFYRYTLERKWPLEKQLRRRGQKKLPLVLSRDEVGKILGEVYQPHLRICLNTIYTCGLRLQEGVQLSVEDIDGERKLLYVRNGKGGRDRAVPLPGATLAQLRSYWKMHRHQRRLFVSLTRRRRANDGPISASTVQKAFRRARDASDVQKQATVHTLRHSYATHLLEYVDTRFAVSPAYPLSGSWWCAIKGWQLLAAC